MKMNYPLKSSNFEERKRSAKRRVLLVVIILIILSALIITRPARQSLFRIATPFWKIRDTFLNSNIIQNFKFKRTLINEKIGLEQKLFLAGNLIAQNEVLQNENDILKDLLGRKEIKSKTVLTTILVKPPQTPYDQLIVDIGVDHGVQVGDKVIAQANVFIGEVSEVYEHTAKVNLYSSPGNKLSVALGTNSVSVETVGIGGGNFNIYLPREIEVKENDVIIIPSITPNVFGIVEKVNFNNQDSFQTILFKSPVNISELGFVEIVLNN